jgi:hypothetical protein
MSYGPTRGLVPEMLGCRIERLLHLDLVPGLTPLLLSERGVPSSAIPTESFRAVVKTMIADRAASDGEDRVALIVGQYLAAGGLLSEVEELDLYAGMVSGLREGGLFRRHIQAAPQFADHPGRTAPRGCSGQRDRGGCRR